MAERAFKTSEPDDIDLTGDYTRNWKWVANTWTYQLYKHDKSGDFIYHDDEQNCYKEPEPEKEQE